MKFIKQPQIILVRKKKFKNDNIRKLFKTS